ncbi:hypothetical protein Tco_1280253 [Tanacetum coccineum]
MILQVSCLFCGSCPDSLNHLFFECNYSKDVWSRLKSIVEISNLPNNWEDIVNLMSTKKHNKSIRSACVYFIWIERNKRHFTNEKQSWKDLVDNVVYHVRLKLASLTVKRTEQVEAISRKLKIVFNVRNEDGILLDTMDLQ